MANTLRGASESRHVIDRVVIAEDQSFGQRILAWRVIADGGVVLGEGKSIGNKRIVLFNLTSSTSPTPSSSSRGHLSNSNSNSNSNSAGVTELVLEVTAAKAQPIIRSFQAFYTCPAA